MALPLAAMVMAIATSSVADDRPLPDYLRAARSAVITTTVKADRKLGWSEERQKSVENRLETALGYQLHQIGGPDGDGLRLFSEVSHSDSRPIAEFKINASVRRRTGGHHIGVDVTYGGGSFRLELSRIDPRVTAEWILETEDPFNDGINADLETLGVAICRAVTDTYCEEQP